MRLLVRGPQYFSEYEFVKEQLDDLTEGIRDIILISDHRIGAETSIDPSHFGLAEQWFSYRWKKNAIYGGDQKKFATIIRHNAPYEGKKQKTKGLERKRLDMMRDCTFFVAFHDIGGKDKETEAMIALAKLFDRKYKVIRV